jgi:predicted TIM-barrel fold metal-dependent hydrolase
MRCIGETEFANGVAAMSASGLYGPTRVCAGIVGCVDFRIGAPVRDVLEAHVAAGNGRFRGVRTVAAWDAHEPLRDYRGNPDGILRDARYMEGFAQLEPLGLSFDAWLYFTQLPDLIALARKFPEVTIIVNHMGGPIAVGPYAETRAEMWPLWKDGLRALRELPNVFLKVGGLGMPVLGFGFEQWPRRPTSLELAEAWRPYMETCFEIFGAGRCMLESNFPPDKKSCDYGVLWNAFKRVTARCSVDEKEALYRGTAARAYRLGGF